MDITIINIVNRGEASEECVTLVAEKDCNLSGYIILDTTYLESGIVSNKSRHSYTFPKRSIKKGELVCLFTGEGEDEIDCCPEYVSHDFYWGLKKSVWNDDGDCAMLAHVKYGQTFHVAEAAKE